MPNTEGTIITASGRTLDEMKAEIRIRMRNMVNSALEIGTDLIEAKEACKHGEWMPFLKEIGLSASTAANYMRIAKEVCADSKMAGLPYTKILALLAAPPEEREELATAAEDMSAAEIRRLTEERNRAAAAANAETARADQAEANADATWNELVKMQREKEAAEQDAKRFNQENAGLRNRISVLENEANKQKQHVQALRDELEEEHGKLLFAENNRIEVEVEKAPADYEAIKAQLAAMERQEAELVAAAAEAEERAAAAEAELEEARSENARNGVSEYDKLHLAMKTFLMQCELMACRPEGLIRDKDRVRRDVDRLRQWCDAMDDALTLHTVEGAVV